MESVIWLCICLLLLFLEANTTALVCIWFAIGSFAAFIASLFKLEFLWCLLIFIAVSVISLIFTRKYALKNLSKPHIPTNADALIGKPAIVTEEINAVNSTGRVLINGQSWSAKARVGHTISKGELVEVVAISGVNLIVVSSDNPLSTLNYSNPSASDKEE